MKRRKGLSRRQAHRIRRGIVGAQMAYAAWEACSPDRASQIYYTVSSFGGITQRALFREFARLTAR